MTEGSSVAIDGNRTFGLGAGGLGFGDDRTDYQPTTFGLPLLTCHLPRGTNTRCGQLTFGWALGGW